MSAFMNLFEIHSEFALQWQIVLRCFVAAICGGIIGIERKNRLKEAGLRTHLILAMGSALMMAVSKYAFFDILRYGNELAVQVKLDPSRVAAGIVSGVGFLGAGTIFVRKQIINGLTTAAGLWVTSGIGMAIGAGMYIPGIAATVILFVAQVFLHKNYRFLSFPVSDQIILRVADEPDVIKRVNAAFAEHDIEVRSLKFDKIDDGILEVECFVRLPKEYTLINAAQDFEQYDFIKSMEA